MASPSEAFRKEHNAASRAPPCPCCVGGSGDIGEEFIYGDNSYRLRRCDKCGSLYYDPPPTIDYRTHTESEYSIRDYVEQNCSVDILAEHVMSGIRGMPAGRMLDIGCGFGFSADVARRIAGWDVTGVEPSTYGRRGAAALGYRLIDDFVGPEHPIAQERFDAVFASEVLEHVTDPSSFVDFLVSMLTPGGRLILSTPDAAVIGDKAFLESDRLAALSPGAHVALFSHSALTGLLHEAGFPHLEVSRHGVSHFVVASRKPLLKQTFNGVAIATDYLRELLQTDPQDDALVAGARFRLFRYLIDLGRLDEAAEMEAVIDWPDPTAPAPNSLAAYLDANRAFAPTALMYRGFLYARHYHDHLKAADYLKQAHKFAMRRVQLGSNGAGSEEHMLWLCLVKAAEELVSAGRPDQAQPLYFRLTMPVSAGLPPIDPLFRDAAHRFQASFSGGNRGPLIRR